MKMLALEVTLAALPLCAFSQSYANSAFSITNEIPATAHVEGWSHGSIRANGLTIDLSESRSALEMKEIRGWDLQSNVDWARPQVFRFYIQYNRLGVTFGYNLVAQPVRGTDQIECTFSRLTDLPSYWWSRDRSVVPVALPAGLAPLVIRSGQVISIATYPAGATKPAVIHYLRLTHSDAPIWKIKRVPPPSDVAISVP